MLSAVPNREEIRRNTQAKTLPIRLKSVSRSESREQELAPTKIDDDEKDS